MIKYSKSAAMAGLSLLMSMTAAGCATAGGAPGKFAENADDGTKIHYVAEGSGPLIVMVHGFPDYHGSFDELRALLKDDYRVAAMDTRGYNYSDQPDEVEAYEMPKLSGDVAAVIKAEGYEKATVIGHDWGGAIAWQFAFRRPDLLERLVIISTPHPATFGAEVARNPAQREASQYAFQFQQEGSENAISVERLLAAVNPKDDAKRAAYTEAFERSNFRGMMNYYRANYPRSQEERVMPDLPKVPVSTLVIHGMQDIAILPAGHNDTWNFIDADTTLMMIPDGGHWVHHDRPELVNQTIKDWLARR